MKQLTELPNIGKTLAAKLESIGVNNAEQLVALGSEKTIIKISTIENSGACLNMLFALEGTILGIRWHHLQRERTIELKEFYKQLAKKSENGYR